MNDYEASHPNTESVSFRDELERHITNSGMSYRQIAGDTYVQLWRATHGQPPDRTHLILWCNELYTHGKITKYDANRLMNLAGYATPQQQKRALSTTTEHRAVVRKG